MKSVDVTAEDPDPPDWLPDLAEVAAATMQRLSILDYDVGILVCNDARIAELNSRYRGIDGPTDVLSFSQDEGEGVPSSDPPGLSGGIALSIDSVKANAISLRVDPAEEAVRVVVHGVLHLAGYDHEGVTISDPAASDHPMLSLQENIVDAIVKEQNE